MTDEMGAVALTAPEAATRNRMTAGDWARVEKHAGLPSIEHHLQAATRELARWQKTVDRWTVLRELRIRQIAAGEWPPKVERVTWGDLQADDVLLDDPNRETLVEDVKTEHGWTYIHYRLKGSLYWRSAPADRKVPIRPRCEQAEAGTLTEAPCPMYRVDEYARWPCVLGEAHSNPDQDPDYDPQLTVHRDMHGTEFRAARCQDPAAHGMPHCWCAVPEHHKPIVPDATGARRTEQED